MESRIAAGGARRRAARAAAFLFVFFVSWAGAACTLPQRTEIAGRAKGAPPPEADLSRTDVLLHARAPIRTGRNALWCATVQLAWDSMADAIGKDGRLALGPPAPTEDVTALNRRDFPHGDLDAESYVAEGGLAGSGVLARIRSRLAAMKAPPFAAPSDLGPLDAVAYAYLRKDLPFAQPFRVHGSPLPFGREHTRVSSFGLVEDDRSPSSAGIAKQALYHGSDGREAPGSGGEFVVELLPSDDADRVLLCAMETPRTLDEGWGRAAALVGRAARSVEAGTDFSVPRIDFGATHAFTELIGSTSTDRGPPYEVRDVSQRIEFTLSETGARLVSWTSMRVDSVGPQPPHPPRIEFTEPFLLALVRRRATRPYFLAWFENADLFVKGA